MAKWIWQFGEMEAYHGMLLHGRRQEYGTQEPPMWRIYPVEPIVRFKTTRDTEGGLVRIRACGAYLVNLLCSDEGQSREYRSPKEIELPPGRTEILVTVYNRETFPAVYMEGAVQSDEDWLADNRDMHYARVGTSPLFTDMEKTPDIFPFSYERLSAVKREKVKDGVLFDFGKETFAGLVISGVKKEHIMVCLGESREEALDEVWSIVHFSLEAEKVRIPGKLTDAAGDEPAAERKDVPGKWNEEQFPRLKDGKVLIMPYAFRYVYISDENAQAEAEYEYLPMEQKAHFFCTEETVGRVWDMAAYTIHLNSREFFLDGIKRDRWVWSGDTYQTQFVNHYLYFDRETEKRTLTLLGGKRPFTMHINAIMDYTFYWMMGLYEYYRTYGDSQFLRQIYPQLSEVLDFCLARRSEDGFMRQKEGDWIFIDWAEMDKQGALLGEQVLFARALQCCGNIFAVLGKEKTGLLPEEKLPFTTEKLLKRSVWCSEEAGRLHGKILELFWDEEKGAFLDSYESGRRNVTRHNNILAYLFLPCTEEQKRAVYENVILNEAVPAITTPYFKFYENQVHCEAGNKRLLEESLRHYYGSMLATGATTLYEQFDPSQSGSEHYTMYGKPYGKSLCHAWSASPIYLLGRYRMGVKNTGIAYDSFEVCPEPGDFEAFEGTVPLPKGEVHIGLNRRTLRVLSTVPGGTLVWKGKRMALYPGQEVVLEV